MDELPIFLILFIDDWRKFKIGRHDRKQVRMNFLPCCKNSVNKNTV